RPNARLTVDGGFTWLKTEVTDPGFSSGDGDVFVKGEELIRRPSRQGRLGVAYLAFGRARLSGDFTFVGRRTDVDFGPFPSVRKELPGYALVDLGADVELLRRGAVVAATLRVENALDKGYETIVGFPGRGRVVLVGVRTHW
ncbi:MAG TPA: TonB-dependent receptor, partial [Gemmatimonadales bacterium]|nr:TonB-dependent receptor [Gemmatimonadales bacterium]